LIYYYKTNPPETGREKPAFPSRTTKEEVTESPWKKNLLDLKKVRDEQVQTRRREDVFGQFTKESPKIPHVEEALSRKAPHLNKLQDLARKYSDHKETIEPGLKPEEKSIFSKLSKIADQTSTKKISEVVSREEAKDIFSKLRDVSDKRKVKK